MPIICDWSMERRGRNGHFVNSRSPDCSLYPFVQVLILTCNRIGIWAGIDYVYFYRWSNIWAFMKQSVWNKSWLFSPYEQIRSRFNEDLQYFWRCYHIFLKAVALIIFLFGITAAKDILWFILDLFKWYGLIDKPQWLISAYRYSYILAILANVTAAMLLTIR